MSTNSELVPAIRLTGATVRYRQRHSFFRHSYHEALKSLDLDVNRGETLGVIGRNGCGKSTLLKLLAGIYSPDEGSVEPFGNRVSLLTLSAGFDPELSGYENAVLSGMLLGNSKSSVLALLDDIFEYSELENAIYQPLKTYSSGMRARLGFAVAIIVETDVLLIDEVLGVGDIKFRQKAEKTLVNRIESDQTVVLVTHSGKQIRRLCKRAIWLEDGVVKMSGASGKVVNAYETALSNEE
jgi:lipopolysaccharide transport system ATP-binding protein